MHTLQDIDVLSCNSDIKSLGTLKQNFSPRNNLTENSLMKNIQPC